MRICPLMKCWWQKAPYEGIAKSSWTSAIKTSLFDRQFYKLSRCEYYHFGNDSENLMHIQPKLIELWEIPLYHNSIPAAVQNVKRRHTTLTSDFFLNEHHYRWHSICAVLPINWRLFFETLFILRVFCDDSSYCPTTHVQHFINNLQVFNDAHCPERFSRRWRLPTLSE